MRINRQRYCGEHTRSKKALFIQYLDLSRKHAGGWIKGRAHLINRPMEDMIGGGNHHELCLSSWNHESNLILGEKDDHLHRIHLDNGDERLGRDCQIARIEESLADGAVDRRGDSSIGQMDSCKFQGCLGLAGLGLPCQTVLLCGSPPATFLPFLSRI